MEDDFQKTHQKIISFETLINFFILNYSIHIKTQSGHLGFCPDTSSFILKSPTEKINKRLKLEVSESNHGAPQKFCESNHGAP